MTTNLKQRKSRILVVDDHALIREGLKVIINREKDLLYCGEADGVVAARKVVAACKPDLVLVDLRLPDGDGLQLIKEFKSQYPALLMLVISVCDEMLYAERALKAGARGYVMKERTLREILTAIRTVLAGEFYVSNKIAVIALHAMAGNKSKSKDSHIGNLTDRELHVFQLLGAGMGIRNIAARLNVSPKTVETHRENIKHKLKLSSAVALTHYATMCLEGQDPHSLAASAKTPKSLIQLPSP